MIIIFFIIVIIIFAIIIIRKIFKYKFMNNSQKENINSLSDDIYKKIENENKEIKIRSYVEKMTLNELTQLLDEDVFKNIPKKRSSIEDEVVKKILNNEIEFKNNNLSYYVDSDKILENDKDYYNKGFKEKKDDIKHFKSIVKKGPTYINMDLFSSIKKE